MKHRTVFPHLLIGLCATFILVLFALNSWDDGNTESSSVEPVAQDTGVALTVQSDFGSQTLPATSNTEYENWLSGWITDVLAAEDIEVDSLRSELFDVTVPAAYKPLHLDLVFLMQGEQGLTAEQRAQMEQFNEQF